MLQGDGAEDATHIMNLRDRTRNIFQSLLLQIMGKNQSLLAVHIFTEGSLETPDDVFVPQFASSLY